MTDEPDVDPGALLRGFRQRALLTQEELAARTGLSTRTIRRLESNQLLRPRTATIRVLVSHLGLTSAEQRALAAGADADAPAEPSQADQPPAPSRRDELPTDIPDFTGRSDLVAALSAALSGEIVPGLGATRLVGVSGMPGVGKTTLAIRVGNLLRSHFPDGLLYVDLRGTSDRPLSPEDAISRLLRRCADVDAALPDDLEERAALFRAMLANRRTLIVLDNARSEAQVRHLLPGGAGCAVLLTSRRPLAALDGLVRFDLGVFRPHEGVELLTRILGVERVISDPAAAEIVELCGNLPLAVRIAGARLLARPHWALRRMADQLADEHRRLDALLVGDRAVRSSIELSYQALGARPRRLFRLLGALTETDVPAWVAGALLDLPQPEAEDLIEDLVDARLVEAHGLGRGMRARYGMHSLVRLYARERCLAEDQDVDRASAALRMTIGVLERMRAGNAAAARRLECALAVFTETGDRILAWPTRCSALGALGRALVDALQVQPVQKTWWAPRFWSGYAGLRTRVRAPCAHRRTPGSARYRCRRRVVRGMIG
ncbi:MAG TPA: NB-ARC domain-containing protein [Actinoplanes sp.]|nr:NB-ARC domain-containing protein [Actinoplanes sp.]